jgi:hypothetical protein
MKTYLVDWWPRGFRSPLVFKVAARTPHAARVCIAVTTLLLRREAR